MSQSEVAAHQSILIVEDDLGVGELVRERLEGMGCECETVVTGREALAAVRERRFDLLVLDFSLPDMDADELIAMDGIPPFVITTGRGDEPTVVRFMRAGARDYVIKDSSFLAELPLVVTRVLRELATERSLADARVSLESRLREKDSMLREIHHRVKNNLQIVSSLIRLQTPADADDRILGIMADIQSRISAMALIHETLCESENLSQVDFLDYLVALSGSLESVFVPTVRPLHIHCQGTPVELSMEMALPLGFIANELLSNSLKHAFPKSWTGEARITARTGLSETGAPFLQVEDNGVGIAKLPGLDTEHTETSLGLKLVRVLGEQIDAQVTHMPQPGGGGTVWHIEPRTLGPKVQPVAAQG